MTKEEFLTQAKQAAMNIGQKWPGYVAAEAALESAYGTSRLATEANNLFGMKAHASTNPEEILTLPTKEFMNGEWLSTVAHWMRYSDWESCLRDRLATLTRLSSSYPHYAAALAVGDGLTFIAEVSKTWSTDPQRGQKVLDIYNEYAGILG